jgi:hypothetical protein
MKLSILIEQNRKMWKEAQRKGKLPENGSTCMALTFPDMGRKDQLSMVEGQTTFALHDIVTLYGATTSLTVLHVVSCKGRTKDS